MHGESDVLLFFVRLKEGGGKFKLVYRVAPNIRPFSRSGIRPDIRPDIRPGKLFQQVKSKTVEQQIKI